MSGGVSVENVHERSNEKVVKRASRYEHSVVIVFCVTLGQCV